MEEIQDDHPAGGGYGKDDEIQIPFWQLPVCLQFGPQNVKGLPLEMMLKNVRHARYEVRTAAA
ncbi:MAG: hypothetical protein WCJ66_10195 [Verrucomicrobiota bacterium]